MSRGGGIVSSREIDPLVPLWYVCCMLRDDSPLPKGYAIKIFPDMKLVMRENEISWSGELRDLLLAILEGRTVDGLTSASGGRGGIFYADIAGLGRIVIRGYRHGGILGGILGGRFLSPKRFLNELAMTERARELGVTLLEPVGIAYRETVMGARGFWISRRMEEATSLHAYMIAFPPAREVIGKAARAVAGMHENGIGHADLNIQNIMIVSKEKGLEVSIIDFDKAFRRDFLPPEERMRQLRRLDRSLLKWLPEGSAWRRPATRLRFAVVYCSVFPGIRPLLKEYIEGFDRYERRYRLGWSLQRLSGGTKRSF